MPFEPKDVQIIVQLIDYDAFEENLERRRSEAEEKKTEISSVEAVSMEEIERWIVNPSSRLERIKFTEKVITNQLPELQRSFFSLEANEMLEVPKALVKFLEKHIQSTKTSKESLSIQK